MEYTQGVLMSEEIIRLLTEQNQILKQLLAKNEVSILGFSDRPPGAPQWIFVGRQGDSCWYTLDKDSQPVPITYRALTGWVVELSLERMERRGRETQKLNITVKSDKGIYILSTGHDTCFAKSLVSSLAILTPEQMRSPITIAVVPGEDENIVWARLYAPELVKAPQWEENIRWDGIVADAIGKVKKALGQSSPQPPSTPAHQINSLHNLFIKRLRAISGHSTDWIISQCRAYGGEQPGDLQPEALRKLVRDMAADFGYTSGEYFDREKAVTSYQSKIAFYEASGKRWGEGVLAWFEEAKSRQGKNTLSRG
jgi:hypothetical protein